MDEILIFMLLRLAKYISPPDVAAWLSKNELESRVTELLWIKIAPLRPANDLPAVNEERMIVVVEPLTIEM